MKLRVLWVIMQAFLKNLSGKSEERILLTELIWAQTLWKASIQRARAGDCMVFPDRGV